MKVRVVCASLLISLFSAAQQPPVKSPLLDHLAGKWVLQGTIAGKPAVHDVDAEWVLDHHYLRIHELARAKDEKGMTYEAHIYITWNDEKWPGGPPRYSCIWLDVFGGLAPESIGVAAIKENELPFLFRDDKGELSFSNVFVYDPASDTWEWRMDNVVKGEYKPFGRVKLTRRN